MSSCWTRCAELGLRRARRAAGGPTLAFALAVALGGCRTPAPPSRFPDAQAALDRLHASVACSRGLLGEAKIDYFGESGRIRGKLLYITHVPNQLRLDVISPFGATLSSLTSDGERFALFDAREKQFLVGRANACNLARFTHVPLPPEALIGLLRGEAPVLVHTPEAATLSWESGEYVIRIRSSRDAREEIHFYPVPADFAKHFSLQRLRVSEVRVEQLGVELYRAELAGHRPARMSGPRSDPDGLEPPIAPSGPACEAEVPGRLHFRVPSAEQDVILENTDVAHNPPLEPGVFRQEPPGGVVVRSALCSD